uniref:Reverse transcriptase Ty1/copia-type domain-containing protein n=1 Tax=Solanum lycopersicum TaxID=4081 RepID=A0A3Q7GXE9_SOLLC
MSYSTVTTPLECNIKLLADAGHLHNDPTYYRKLVGKLNFLTNTRLDIAYNVQQLSQYMQAPRERHLKAAMHVLRYLKNDPGLGIFMSRNSTFTLKAFCDSDCASCPDSKKLVSGA